MICNLQRHSLTLIEQDDGAGNERDGRDACYHPVVNPKQIIQIIQ